MATRDMNKIAREAIIPARYDMTYGQANSLCKSAKENSIYNAIATAFNYGFVMGQRYQKNTMNREKTEKDTPAQTQAV